MITRPMKPYKLSEQELVLIRYPVLVTPKIDGIRCTKVDGQALTASHKAIPNIYIRSLIEQPSVPNGFDGELVTPGSFTDTTSAVMSISGTPTFVWRVFDYIILEKVPYVERVKDLAIQLSTRAYQFIDEVKPTLINNETELLQAEEVALTAGYEGLIMRDPLKPYKNGRSTLNEQGMLALKRFTDAEAVVISVTEKHHNANSAEVNELGLTKRSHSKGGMQPAGTMGSLHVRDLRTDVEFDIGTGFTDYQRSLFWSNPPTGKIIKYKSLHHGVKNAPRHPVFLGFRAVEDMTLSSPIGEGSQQ